MNLDQPEWRPERLFKKDDHPICTCPRCGAKYSGADRRGGHCAACCTTFTSQTSFDAHRYGPYDGDRKCMTQQEMEQAGFRDTDRGWTNSPPMPDHLKGVN